MEFEDDIMRNDLVEDALDRTNRLDTDQNEKQKTAAPLTIHIQYQRRTTRKGYTTISNLPEDLDLKKISQHMRREWQCSGAVIHSDQFGGVIQLSGDNRKLVQQFLIEEGLATKAQIKIHGL